MGLGRAPFPICGGTMVYGSLSPTGALPENGKKKRKEKNDLADNKGLKVNLEGKTGLEFWRYKQGRGQ